MRRERVTCGFVCTRGGLFTIVHAASPTDAADKAGRAMGLSADRIVVRPALPADHLRWAALLAQSTRHATEGVDAFRIDRAPGHVQLELVA